jgi:S-adenosylmethionine uptake transporter
MVLTQAVKVLSWFMQKGYLQGVFWMIMISVVSASNDVIMCLTGLEMHWVQVLFFRYLFGMILVLPFMMKDTTLFKTTQISGHIFRAIFGTVGIGACCYSVINMPLSENETIMYVQPFIFLILAYFVLKEHVTKQRWFATLVGFAGLLVVVRPGTEMFRWTAMAPLVAATSFALLDMFATKMIKVDRDITLMFYFAVGTVICAFIPLFFVWQMPTMKQLVWLACLGVGGNLIQVCIYRAFSATEASGLMPFRYMSLLIASLAEFMVFGVIPASNVLIGAVIIIAAALYIATYEKRKESRIEPTTPDLQVA